jgi:hypothetical protein
VQFAAERALVQGLNVLEPMFKTIASQVDLVLRHRVKHEGIVGIGGVSQREDGRFRRHERTLSSFDAADKMLVDDQKYE